MKKTLGIILAVLALIVGIYKVSTRDIPPIHDISTDTEKPPEFKQIKVTDYGGPEVAAQQVAAYPDVKPLELDAPLLEVFNKAVELAKEMGWEIVVADSATGRIEATATMKLMHFKDDIAVRVALSPTGTRVDLRSVSRVGKSDLGANAKRITEFLSSLRGALPSATKHP